MAALSGVAGHGGWRGNGGGHRSGAAGRRVAPKTVAGDPWNAVAPASPGTLGSLLLLHGPAISRLGLGFVCFHPPLLGALEGKRRAGLGAAKPAWAAWRQGGHRGCAPSSPRCRWKGESAWPLVRSRGLLRASPRCDVNKYEVPGWRGGIHQLSLRCPGMPPWRREVAPGCPWLPLVPPWDSPTLASAHPAYPRPGCARELQPWEPALFK